VVAILVLSTTAATPGRPASRACLRGSDRRDVQPSPWTLPALSFLIARWLDPLFRLIWRAWSSLWIFARRRGSGQSRQPSGAEARISTSAYGATVLMAACLFLVLGGLGDARHRRSFSPAGAVFCAATDRVYTPKPGGWAYLHDCPGRPSHHDVKATHPHPAWMLSPCSLGRLRCCGIRAATFRKPERPQPLDRALHGFASRDSALLASSMGTLRAAGEWGVVRGTTPCSLDESAR